MKKIISVIFFILLCLSFYGQSIVINGYVSNKTTGEKLISAIVFADSTNAVSTNEFGFFSIKLKKDKSTNLHCKQLGFSPKQILINADIAKTINIQLSPNTQLNAVTIYGNKNKLDYYSFSSDRVKELPSLTGEKDIVKSLQLMPGVQFGNEGTSDLYVRGGTPDQNLILVDDMPMHFINHLGSFVSVFDINAINKIKLIKNGFPAEYGNNLSSILDIRMKDGNIKKLEGELNFGIISSKISLNGPIIKDKISFVLTFRRTNLDLISWGAYFIYNDGTFVNYKFYDANAKINYKISEKDKIDISVYNGGDYNKMIFHNSNKSFYFLNLDTKFNYNFINHWGNYLNSFRWTHVYSNSLFQKFIIGYSTYKYSKEKEYKEINKSDNTLVSFGHLDYLTKIQDFVFKLDYNFFINSKNRLNFGVASTKHIYNPGAFHSKAWSYSYIDTISGFKNEEILNPLDLDFYLEYKLTIDKFVLTSGLHSNIYLLKNKLWKNFQPRLKIEFEPNENNILNITYDRTYQNIHVLTMSNAIVPADIWVPATTIAPPENAHQFSVGFSHYWSNNYTISISAFYKKLNNLIDYKRSFYITDTVNKNPSWEQQIVTGGKGQIYGLELLLEKNKGKFTGWVSYTFMHNYRQFADLNNGEAFPFNYDRRHNLKIVAQYNISKNLSINAVFMYGSGYPLSLDVIKQNYIDIIEGKDFNGTASPYLIDKNTNYFSNYSYDKVTYVPNKINSYRMPAYNRLDISLNWSKQKKHGIRTWSFNIYNVYNQQNALYLYLDYDLPKNPVVGEKYPLALFKFTLFPILPSVSYSFKF